MKGKSIMHRHYSTSNIRKKVPVFLAVLLLAGMIALNLAVPEPVTEPDGVYPMANAKISWLESFHCGGWEE